MSILIVMILSGCLSMYQGAIQSSTSLHQRNFKTVKTVQGVAIARYFLGVGGFSIRDGLYADAKDNLLKNNPLQEGQALANITTDYKTSMILYLYASTELTMTADIIEFTK